MKGRWLALAVPLGAFAGLSGFTAQYAEGLSYLSNDPRACANCHIMNEQYDSWRKGPHHAAATCNGTWWPRPPNDRIRIASKPSWATGG